MLKRVLVVCTTVAAIAVFAIVSQPVKAGSCKVIVAEGRGANQAKATARSQKHLTFKINRWASKNGVTSVGAGKSSTVCSEKGAISHCIASRQVCG